MDKLKKLTGQQAVKMAKEISFDGLRQAAAWRMKPTGLPGHKLVRGPPPKAHYRRGDMVEVIEGEEMGKRGKVHKVFRYDQKLIVYGVNQQVTTEEQYDAMEQLQTTTKTKHAPIPMSSVRFVDPERNELSGIGYDENGRRISTLTGELIPNPSPKVFKGQGPRDTSTEKYLEETFNLDNPWKLPFPKELTR